MDYTKYVYQRVNWKNKSDSLETPLGKTNLNRMDSAIYNIAENLDIVYNKMSTEKFDKQDANKVICGMPTWDSQTGVLSFRFYDGTEFVVDFNIEKIPVSFSMDSSGVITMITSDGEQWTANIGDVIPDYVFHDSERIVFSRTKSEDGSYSISADIIKGSITDQYLEPSYLSNITEQASKSEESANLSREYSDNSSYDAKLSQSYAVGGSGIRENEDTDNAKYYYQQAKSTDVGQLRQDVDVINDNVIDLQMLGWEVPSEMSVKNSVTESTFIQKVDRQKVKVYGGIDVSAGGLTWFDTDIPFSTNILSTHIKKIITSNDEGWLSKEPCIAPSNSSHVRYYFNIGETFDDIIYYELSTPITMQIDGNEAIEKLNRNLDTLEFGENYGNKNLARKTENGYTSTQYDAALYCMFYGEEGKQYTISFVAPSGLIIYPNESLFSEGSTFSCTGSRQSVTYTLKKNVSPNKLVVLFKIGANNSVFPNFTDIQIEEGTTATPYEPYIPSVKMLAEDLGTVYINHNGILVEKDITAYFTDNTLRDRIARNYDGIFPGCYIDMGRTVTCKDSYDGTVGSRYVTVASCGGLKGIGNIDTLNKNHLVMVPGQGVGGTQHFGRHAMNDSNTTVGGYKGSKMNTDVIGVPVSEGSIASGATINQQLRYIFGDLLQTSRELVSNSIEANLVNRFRTANGASNNWGWESMQAILMSEIELYGSIVWSSSGYDTGTARRQLDLFRLCEEAINNRSAYYWLKDVASASFFCYSARDGYADYNYAGSSNACVRPRFIIA